MIKFICKRCLKPKQSLIAREYCNRCQYMLDVRSSRLATHEKPETRNWKQYTDQDVKEDLASLVRRLVDLGSSGPVTHITPDHPMFEKVAAQCTHIRRIGR